MTTLYVRDQSGYRAAQATDVLDRAQAPSRATVPCRFTCSYVSGFRRHHFLPLGWMSKHNPPPSESLYALSRARASRTDTSVSGMEGLQIRVWVTLSDLGSYVSSEASVTHKATHFQTGLARDAVGRAERKNTGNCMKQEGNL